MVHHNYYFTECIFFNVYQLWIPHKFKLENLKLDDILFYTNDDLVSEKKREEGVRNNHIHFLSVNHWFEGILYNHVRYANRSAKWEYDINNIENIQISKYDENEYVGLKSKVLDITKIQKLYDLKSRQINLQKGIEKTIKWYQSKNHL